VIIPEQIGLPKRIL